MKTDLNINEILEKHKRWLNKEPDGECANLSGADLSRANLSCAYLSCANLSYADLSYADLRWANLRCANLYHANLSHADLSHAYPRGTNLSRANLSCAYLRWADLSCAYLSCADLNGANLSGADLNGANLSGADLSGADLSGADLSGADLNGVPIAIINKIYPLVCPEYGAFIGWKKAKDDYIVKLQITETAKRSSATGRKCRCSEALVLAIETDDGTPANVTTINSRYNADFRYTVGETVRVDNFDENRMNECAPGIHFFITRQEAVDYI